MIIRLGNNINVRLGKDAKPSANSEQGASGTSVFAGLLYENEYNSDLQGDKGLKIYDKMRRSDGQVKAGLLACKLPLLVAHWDMQPASRDPIDVEIANAVGDNLFGDMTITWDDFLRQSMLMLDFGHMVFEKVWELRGGRYAWKKLAPRLPTSIMEWHLTDDEDLDYIKQAVNKGNTFIFPEIKADKLLVFTHEKEGADYRGMSLLRAAYKHWYYKNNLYAIDGIAAERHGVGFARFYFEDNATKEQKDYIDKIGQRLHSHERAYAALPKSVQFDLLGVQGQLHDIKGSIEHHDLQIVRSILAQFMNLGAKATGSFALSNDQSRFFLMALQAVGKNIEETINRQAIKQCVDYNWNVSKYPRLRVSGLDNPDITAYAQAISSLATAGLITKTPDLENELLRMLKLPLKSNQTEEQVSPEASPDAPESESDNPAPAESANPQEAKEPSRIVTTESRKAAEHSMREPRGPETFVAFKDMAGKLDTAEARLRDAVKPIQDRQIKALADQAAKYMKSGSFDKLPEIDVPFRDKVADAIGKVFDDVMRFGAEQVRKERAKQGRNLKAAELPERPSREGLLRTRAQAIANILAAKMKAAVTYEALAQSRGGEVDIKALVAAMTSLSNADLNLMASFSVSDALNTGRAEQAAEYGDEIDHVYSSALMDDNTCAYCAGQDGKTWPYGEQPDEPPYEECEGRDRCRCIFVYVYKAEV